MISTSTPRNIRVMFTPFRDGLQSSFGGKVRLKDFLPAMEASVKAGIRHFEFGGGARFQAPMFYLGENPFETMETIRNAVGPNIALQILTRSVSGVTLTTQSLEGLSLQAKLMQGAGIRNVLVTNGMLNPEPLAELLPLVSAMNIDLKSVRPEFYRDYVKGDLETVLGTIRAARKACHVELTNLLIPGRNDSEREIRELVDFVASLGRETVLHFSRYFPRHRATEPSTPAETLARATAIAREKLDYVYLGNVGFGDSPRAGTVPGRDTFCPKCRNRLVERSGYAGRVVGIAEGKCAQCGRKADFVLA